MFIITAYLLLLLNTFGFRFIERPCTGLKFHSEVYLTMTKGFYFNLFKNF